MIAESALLSLRDIHLPNPLSFTLFYCAIISFFIIFLSFLSVILLKIRQKRAPEREALRLLKNYETTFLKDKDVHACCAQISQLLKRIALVDTKRENIASLTGAAWIDFLNQRAKKKANPQVLQCLFIFAYNPQSTPTNLAPLFQFAKRCIKKGRKLC